MGLSLIEGLSKQLGGQLRVQSSGGVCILLTFNKMQLAVPG